VVGHHDWSYRWGWDYVSELLPPSGLLFIPHVICEHGDPWWVMMQPDSSKRALWQFYQQFHLRQVGGIDEISENFVFQAFFFCTCDVLRAVKFYDMGPPALLPIRRKMCCGIVSPLTINRLCRVWTRDPRIQRHEHLPLRHRGDLEMLQHNGASFRSTSRTVST
jgi:hypothetical protein